MAEGWGCGSCGGSNPDGTRYCGWCGTATVVEEQQDEQRVITALFADISGFTTLADTLETEALHDIISPVISLLAGIAERYGGTLAKFAGDAVLVFFGAPVAQEDHAARALLCAMEMHRELADALPRLPPEASGLELHIGVNSGRVIAGMFGGDIRNDYSILGDAVNVAQRLESVAPPGETYVGELTRDLTAREFVLDDLGELTLKGKTKPVPAWRLLGRKELEHAQAASTALIGRDRELAEIVARLDELSAGAGSVIGVVAEPGGGKTRLTQEARHEAEQRGMLWLEARCISYGAGVAYYPFVDLVRRACGIGVDQDPVLATEALQAVLDETNLGHLAPYFTRLLGLPAPRGGVDLSDLEPEAFRRQLHDAFATWVRALAAVTPVVLAVEDLHWVDSASFELTAHVRPIADDARVLVYATGRPEALETIGTLVDAAPSRSSITLGPLGRDSTRELVAASVGRPPSDALLDVVVERAEGNPFFAEELVRSLLDTGDAVVVDGRADLRPGWSADALPSNVEAVLAARIDLLPRPAASLLQMAAVVGRKVDLALLEGVAEDVVDLPRLVDQLIAGGFLDRTRVGRFGDEQVVFHHALVVDVAYGRLVGRQRRDLHRRVAETAEAVYGTGDDVIDLLARHLYLAEAGVKAVDYLQRAGERSARLFANEEAILHVGRAVELARRTKRVESRLPGLILRMAELEDLIGEFDVAEKLFVEVRELTGDVRAWRGVSDVLRKRGDFTGALALIDEAFTDARLIDVDVTPLWLARTYILGTSGRLLEAIEAAHAGLEAAPSRGSDTAQLLLLLALAEAPVGRIEEALAHGARAQAILVEGNDLRGLARAKRIVGDVQTQADCLDDAVATLHQGLELAQRTGSVEDQAGCLISLGLLELRRGNVADALEADRRALSLYESIGHVSGQATTYANLAEKLLAADAIDDAATCGERGLTLARDIGSAVVIADASRTLARIRLAEGRPDEARELAEASARLYSEIGDDVNARDALGVATDAVTTMNATAAGA